MDKARKITDKELARMERALKVIYTEARSGIVRNWNEYMDAQKPKLDALKLAYDEAKKSGDKDLIKKTGAAYGKATREATLQSKYYRDMVEQTTLQLANVNAMALDYVNGKMPKIYNVNYNQLAQQVNGIGGYRFDLVNRAAVDGLTKSLNIAKDMKYNTRCINSQVLQGILQGESVDKIAGRLEHVVGMNSKAAIRNARTMTTRAENRGRQDSYEKATEDGIILTRIWIATNDDRTREWHADLDGVEVGVDEPWENEYGEIMYPADPSADPANVYNCRCAMRVDVKGFNF